MRRRRRVIHIAELDRPLAEAEAIRRAIDGGARWARVETCERVVDRNETPVWEITLRVPRGRAR